MDLVSELEAECGYQSVAQCGVFGVGGADVVVVCILDSETSTGAIVKGTNDLFAERGGR